MRDFNKQDFIFKCEECNIVVEISFIKREEVANVMENKVILDCPCGGICKALFN